MIARRLLIAYALANAVLYSVLMPLWEGFDEPFHFAYVQQLANGQGLPDPRTSRLSGEVGASVLLAPASQVVKRNLPQVTSYSEFFAGPAEKRAEVRRQLWDIPPHLRWQSSQFVNYEAQHPPLAYVLLAFPERLLAHVTLPMRVAILRMIAAVAGALLLLVGAEHLFSQLRIRDPWNAVALFCVFSCQMAWATLAHVGNDWLAVPIAVWMLVALLRYDAGRRPGTAAAAAVILALGLLTKAYFLAFVPLLPGLCVWRRRWRDLAIVSVIVGGLAGPWYARNVVRYGDLTGTQQSRAGVNLHAVLKAAPTMNWAAVIPATVRSALWTGNNTFLAFSANTLNLLIVTALLALLLWGASRHASAEWITIAYCGLFVLALGYDATVSLIYTHQAATEPWYAQVLSAPLLGLALLGASRWPRFGRAIAALLVVLFGYVLAATYAVKLIPLYGGYEGRSSIGAVTSLYAHRLQMLIANLDTVTLASGTVVCLLTGIAIALALAQQILLIRGIFARTESLPDPRH